MNLIKLNLNDIELAFGSAIQRIAMRFWSLHQTKTIIEPKLLETWAADLFLPISIFKTTVTEKDRDLIIHCKNETEDFKWIINLKKPLYMCATLVTSDGTIEDINVFAFKYEI